MIITDYCMPGMSGYELLKKIKVISYTVLPFIVDKSIRGSVIESENDYAFVVQESSTLREIPVVIMSSENVLTRIDRYRYMNNFTKNSP